MQRTIVGTGTAVCLSIFPFLTTNALFYGAINTKFFAVSVGTTLLALAAAHKLFSGSKTVSKQGKFFFVLLAALGVQVLAAIFGLYPGRSFWSDIFWSSGVFFLVQLVVLAVLLGALLTKADWALVRRAVAYSAGLFSVLSIVGSQGFRVAERLWFIDLTHSGSTLGNETYAGVYLALALMVTLSEWFASGQSKRARQRLAFTAGVISLSPLLIGWGLLSGETSLQTLISNPAGILGTARASSAAVLVLWLFLVARKALQYLIPETLRTRSVAGLGIATVVLLTVGTSQLFVSSSAVQNAYVEASSAARVIVWEAAWQAAQERPLLGWGPENFNFALERHFDPKLFLEENLAEIWFDRAHNVFLDTIISSGLLGLLSGILVIGVYIMVVRRAYDKEHITEGEATLLVALVPLHILQLQTGFDTVSSYTLLAVVAGYALFLERCTQSEESAYDGSCNKGIAFVLGLLVLGNVYLVVPEYLRQRALVETFRGRSLAEQETLARRAVARESSFESLRLSSASFIKGSLTLLADKRTPERVDRVRSFAMLYDEEYKTYIAAHPDHYRARVNYAYLLLVMMALGEDRVSEAKEVLQGAYELSPGNPLTYVLHSIAELYDGDVSAADRLMLEALAINPDIEVTQAAAAYLERQKETFPNLSVLRLENL